MRCSGASSVHGHGAPFLASLFASTIHLIFVYALALQIVLLCLDVLIVALICFIGNSSRWLYWDEECLTQHYSDQ
jgi:hypothetical protein